MKIAEHGLNLASLQELVDSVPALIHTARPDGSLDFFNQPWLEFVGLRLEDLEGWKWTAVIHPDDVSALVAKWRACVASGEPFEFESRVRRADGAYRWMWHQKLALRDAGGEIVKWYGSSVDIDDRKRAEYEVRKHETVHVTLEAQLQATLNIIPAYTWYAAPSGALTFVNRRCADYLGLPSDHPLRFGIDTGAAWDSHLQFLHPDDHEDTRRIWSTSLRTGSAGGCTFRARSAAGAYRWFLSQVEPLRANDGTLLYWIGINVDIEERKQAEFYLAEAQRLAHTGSWIFSAAGFEYWSPELLAIHGLDPGGTAPTVAEYMALVHPDDREVVAKEIQKMLTDHLGFDFTKRIVRPDGSIRHVRCVGTPETGGGIFQGFAGTGIDVTEHEELTKALRKGEAELRQTLDFAPQLIAVFGPGRERMYANRTALEYIGVSLDEWRQSGMGSDIHPDEAERHRAQAERSLSMGLPYELELRIRSGDGGYRWFLARYNPVRDDEGQIIRLHVSGTDIDDRKRAEERLQQENVALREEVDKALMFEEIVGASAALKRVLTRVSKVAASDSTVLINGETGTGKELVARAIHRRSARSSRAFVAVNCAAARHRALDARIENSCARDQQEPLSRKTGEVVSPPALSGISPIGEIPGSQRLHQPL